jgi:probable F420-dependent oxidoreductase
VPIRIGVQIQPQHADFADLRSAWLRAEELGADVVFTWDHFFPLSGDRGGKHFECWTVIAAMAEATSRVQVGALVACNSYRNPQLTADMVRTVDHISGGRAILGIGSGWAEIDYREYGYEFGTAPSRLRDLAAALPAIESRLEKLNPGPVNGHIPILIGGGGEQVTLRLVARHADIWHAFGDVETFKRKDAILRDWCREVGRDESEIERSWTISPSNLGAADGLADAGVGMLSLGFSGPDYDLAPLTELVAWRDARA